MPEFIDPGGRLPNYNVITNKGTLTITRANLTVAAHGAAREYRETNPPLTGVVGGLRPGDAITDHLLHHGAGGDSPVGNYDILPGFSDPGGKLRNYMVITNKGILTISRTRLIVKADDKRRVYGESNPRLTGEITGLRRGDGIKVNFDTLARGDTAIGTSEILPVFRDPDGRLQNYTVITNVGRLTITSAPLTVTADNKKRVYGEANPRFTGDLKGVRRGDDISVAYNTPAEGNSPVGHYDILPALSNPHGKLSDYTVMKVNGTLTITPARLKVNVDSKLRGFGSSNPALTGKLIGLLPDDHITVSYHTPADLNSPPGRYDILPVLDDPEGKLRNYEVVTNLGVLKITTYTAVADKPAGKPPMANVLGISNFDFIWMAGLRNGKGAYVEKTELSQTQFTNLAGKFGVTLEDANQKQLNISGVKSDEPVNIGCQAALQLCDAVNKSSSPGKPPGQFQLPGPQDFPIIAGSHDCKHAPQINTRRVSQFIFLRRQRR